MIDVKSMTFADIGESFTRIDADRTLILHGFLSKVGETPSFDSWESARKEWGTGYKRIKTAANDDAVNTAWSRFVGSLRNYAAENGFTCTVPEKPKSTNPEAVKKAESRVNPFVAMGLADARKAQAEIMTRVSEAQKAGAVPPAQALEDMARVSEAVVKLEKEAGKERLKVVKEKLAPRIDALKKRLNQADERFVTLVELIADATDMRNNEQVRANAWAAIAQAMPAPKAESKSASRKAA